MPSAKEQLAQTQKELEDLRKEYQEFAYAISHDLGAPFRQIDGFSKIISKNNRAQFDQKTMQQFNLISKGAHRGMSIIDVLLDFSRLDTRAGDFVEVDCKDIINEVFLAASTNPKIKKHYAIGISDMPVVKADKKQLYLLFHHIIDNALKYTSKTRETHIEISSEKIDGGWKFFVEDNGVGINETSKEKVFKVLHRDITNTEHIGNGMGLALAKKIVTRHNGSISAEPTDSEGTIVTFTIETE